MLSSVDGQSGARAPIALKIPTTRVDSYQIPGLRVLGTCSYPANYPRVAQCRLVGELMGAPENTPAIISRPWSISLPTSNSPTQNRELGFINPTSQVASGAGGFEISAIIKDKPCPVPFRLAGDFQWRIECVNIPNGTLTTPLLDLGVN